MHKKMHHGIFIDVFVLDTRPENVKERKLFFIKNRFLVQLYLAKHLTTSFTADVNPLKVFVRKFLHFLLFPISSDFLYRQLDNHAKKYHDDHSKYLHQSGRDHKMPYIYTKNDFSGKRKILFESVEAYVPAGNHTILTYRYGDYMKIPSEEYRYNHRPVKIEFDVSGFSQEQKVNNPLKICILTPRFPFPENGGDVLRINNISRYLKSKGHTLVLVSYCTQKDIDNQDNITDPLYDRIYYIKRNTFVSLGMSFWAFLLNKPIQIGYYFSFTYLAKFKKTIKEEKPDLYISHLLRMVPFLNLCRLQDKSIVEMTDALSKTYGMSGNVLAFSLKRIIYLIERKRIAAYERRTIAKYKKCVLVSQMDKDYLESYGTLLKAD
jgi:hypothetical protein